MSKDKMTNELPDIQLTKPKIQIPIQKVGIEGLKLPLMLQLRDNNMPVQVTANCSLYTDIDSNTKGISMSRLVLLMRSYLVGNKKFIKQERLKNLLNELAKNIGSNNSFISLSFDLLTERKSALSDYSFPIFTPAFFEGVLIDGEFKFRQGLEIQYASYCPCSSKLCEDLEQKGLKGFPHNQRSFAKIICDTTGNKIYLEDILNQVIKELKTIPYPVIKRVDEQEIARIASSNAMFVEDAVRTIANVLNRNRSINDWIVKSIHHESIHFHNAVACCWKNVRGGFSENTRI